MFKQELQERVAEILGVRAEKISLAHTEDFSHGDYSTNIAFVLAKEKGENPKELAASFVAKLAEAKLPNVSKVEVAGAGFINFYLTREFFAKNIAEILKEKEDFGNNKSLEGKKVMIEYTDPNPFKEFHIGHLMTNTIGESIAQLFVANGAETKKVCYQSDVGLHVAEAVWAIKKSNILNPTIKDLGNAYTEGNKAYRENNEAKKEIEEINKALYSHEDSELNKLYETGRSLSLQYFETIYEKLGTKFDHYFFEGETAIFGKKMVEEGLDKGVFEKGEEGAIIYNGEKHGLHTRVFINKFGIPIYEAKDLGLTKLKYDTFPYDSSISVTANEITEYFKVVKSALSQLEPELAEKLRHIPHGVMKLPSGKMSSRTGDVITALSLIDEVKAKVLEKMKGREIGNMDMVAEQIAIGAIKYSILKQSPGKDIIFDFDKSISFEGDSGPYLQYSAVRANSVLEKAKGEGIKSEVKNIPKELSEVERLLPRFPEIVERAVLEFAPQYVATYLIELAGAFNTFYANTKVLDGSDSAPYRLAITEAVKTVLTNGLHILAIKVPEKM
ncbi:MAG: arginine--tRNA ligase [bacterium]|nr:arginine--tRNA ligase [bacterium]